MERHCEGAELPRNAHGGALRRRDREGVSQDKRERGHGLGCGGRAGEVKREGVGAEVRSPGLGEAGEQVS